MIADENAVPCAVQTSVLRSGDAADSFDQAGDLRRLVEQKRQVLRQKRQRRVRTLAVLSGKGGVGKSNIALALSCALADKGSRVLLLDADLGMANLDILCGINAKYNLSHIVSGSRTIDEVLTPLEERVNVLPGGAGLREMADLDERSLMRVFDSLTVLEDKADIIVLDTGAGIHRDVISFARAADTALLVTTPEPTSVRDAYGVLKAMDKEAPAPPADGKADAAVPNGDDLLLTINMAAGAREARNVSDRIRKASQQFLGRAPSYLGYIARDVGVERAVRRREIFYRVYPSSPASVCIKNMADELMSRMDGTVRPEKAKGLRAFFLRLTSGFKF